MQCDESLYLLSLCICLEKPNIAHMIIIPFLSKKVYHYYKVQPKITRGATVGGVSICLGKFGSRIGGFCRQKNPQMI